MCLDTLASNNSLYMHVSKPPKEGSSSSAFYKELKSIIEEYPTVTVEGWKDYLLLENIFYYYF